MRTFFEVVSSFLLYPAEKVIATIETKSSGKQKNIYEKSVGAAKKLKDCVDRVIPYIAKEMPC